MANRIICVAHWWHLCSRRRECVTLQQRIPEKATLDWIAHKRIKTIHFNFDEQFCGESEI